MTNTLFKQFSELQKRMLDINYDIASQGIKQSENFTKLTLATTNLLDDEAKDQLTALYDETQSNLVDFKNLTDAALNISKEPKEVSSQALKWSECAYSIALKNISFAQEWNWKLADRYLSLLPKESAQATEHYKNTLAKGVDFLKDQSAKQFDVLRSATHSNKDKEAGDKFEKASGSKKSQ